MWRQSRRRSQDIVNIPQLVVSGDMSLVLAFATIPVDHVESEPAVGGLAQGIHILLRDRGFVDNAVEYFSALQKTWVRPDTGVQAAEVAFPGFLTSLLHPPDAAVLWVPRLRAGSRW